MIRQGKMTEARYSKLCEIIRERDRVCWRSYEEHMHCGVPTPFDHVEVHHVIHRGNGGPDREDNLMSLSYVQHRFDFHGDNGETRKRCDEAAKAYLQCEEVARWREAHAEELEAFYEEAEEAAYRRARRKNECHSKWGPMPRRAV